MILRAQLLSCVRLFWTFWAVATSLHGIFQARILEPVVICLLQGILPTQGSNTWASLLAPQVENLAAMQETQGDRCFSTSLLSSYFLDQAFPMSFTGCFPVAPLSVMGCSDATGSPRVSALILIQERPPSLYLQASVLCSAAEPHSLHPLKNLPLGGHCPELNFSPSPLPPKFICWSPRPHYLHM